MPYFQLTWICSCWPVGKPFPVSSFPTFRSKTICHMVYVNYRSQIIHMILRQTESHCETNGFELPILGPRAMWTNPPEKLEWFKNPPHAGTHLRLIRLTLIDIDWQWSLMVYADCLWNFCSQRPSQHFQNWKFRAGHQVTKGHQSRTDNDYSTGLSDFPVIPPRQNRTSSLELHGYLARCIQQDPTGSTWND